MLLLVSCALLVLYRTSCFLALKYHVLLATVVFSCLQSIHMDVSPKHYKMSCVCFFTTYPIMFVYKICSWIMVQQKHF
jgi:hypothetical protein